MKTNIPIFDTLTHPTLNQNWILPTKINVANIDDLIFDMESNNITNALAVGMKGIGNYSAKGFVKMLKPFDQKLFPIAFADFDDDLIKTSPNDYAKMLEDLGYVGVKIHPRFAEITINEPIVEELINACANNNLIVLICTYFYANSKSAYLNNTTNLIKLLSNTYPAPIILVHAGGVKLLEYLEIARAFNNVLLDLSFTILRYAGTSLEDDLKFLFNNFDRRICIGSDHPELKIADLRKRFDLLSSNITKDKALNIANRNISNFLNKQK